MKFNYEQPECEIIRVNPRRVLCASGDLLGNASIDKLSTSTVEGSDYDQLF